ncbi:Ig-like domain-containing protein [Nocardioides sp. Arc9.136]|uniref:Ig-like domain-containing protein n=1 Tax=Nocardioides sp. Arc9.136 TaxID=2996826 RepID=UPI002665E0DC|nr:Ig-like domain-containing protein [Nocardioides sp. Arc9.136]WKN48767.1 Ig-like domain-containing protein [Nocardioides sp. Arc9.136]
MQVATSTRWRTWALVPLLTGLALAGTTTVPAAAAEEPPPATTAEALVLPDPMDRGDYTPRVVQEAKLGTVALQEPSSAGGEPTPQTVAAPEELEIRGQLHHPDFTQRTEQSPVIVLVHGNHGSCDAGSDTRTATCTTYKRNEAGYAYLGENLATWGYTVFSVSQDQLMLRQDNPKGKGMHQRRLLISATLDALAAADEGTLVDGPHVTIGDTLTGHLDMTRIGLMGHSRGGDAVTNFLDHNRTRTDGPRYPLRGVISLAQTDYERKVPYGVPYLSILPFCDGDVSNLQGARTFERGQYLGSSDLFPRIQSSQLGAIHNWYNTVWYADGGADGQSNNDAACGNSAPFSSTNVHPHNLRLSGAANYGDPDKNYVIDNSDTYNPEVNTKISGDPERMGDQEKIGLATMAAFFRRYVGGEGAFEPYMTGELSDTPSHRQIPDSACPTSVSGTRIDCAEYVSTSYFPSAAERVDVIRPEIENPLGLNALGGSLSGAGFANPYLTDGGVTPKPATTPGGYDWCNPEPDDFAPGQLGKTTQPTAAKACPLPAKAALGGQNGTRENSPINHSYGRQLALAWEKDQQAVLTADIPAADADVSGLEALALGTDVNFFDQRNPGADARGDGTRTGTTPSFSWPNEGPTSYDPESTTQDFVIALTDSEGHEGTVHAGDERWGNALHMSTGTNTPNTHVVLDQVRVPLDEFAAQGVDLTSLDTLELRFGAEGTPASGSIQLADVRFQERVDAPLVLSDGTAVDQGAGSGPVTSGPDPAAVLAAYDNSPGKVRLADTVADPFADTTWVVDDDRAQCPAAGFTSIQEAVDSASPWDTIVVCEGVYQESSTPVDGPGNPVAAGATNGLTITKPLKIKGAGADKVTIQPRPSVASLAGATPYLRDGGGNVVTVSRQSLGSTDSSEMFVDISGVTVTSGQTWAEAGIAYFGAAGRVSQSVVGPLRVAADSAELASHPHGWGIVKTGVIEGAGPGTVETELTVSDSVVTGYQSGGVLIDGAKGVDGAPKNTRRTGIEQHGYVTGTVVQGSRSEVFAQTGVAFTSGADGFVRSSRVTGNDSAGDPSTSYGILLADARTEAEGALTGTGNVLTGNGWAVWNATADRATVRTDAPFVLTGSVVGEDEVSGSGSVTVESPATTAPADVPSTYGAVVDDAPSVALVDPVGGDPVAAGEPVAALVRADDDVAVRSAALLVDGKQVGTSARAPHYLTWTPDASYAGQAVTLTAVATDSSGHETTSEPVTVRVAGDTVPGPPVPGTPGPTDPTTPTDPTDPTDPGEEPTPVDPPVTVPPTVSVGVTGRNTARGTVVVGATLSAPGTVRLKGDRVVAVGRTVTRAGTVRLTVRVKPAFKKLLVKRGRLKVSFTVTVRTAAGSTSVVRTVTLRRK